MKTRASIAGHPIHPMLVVFPIGLWIFSFICDLIFLGTGNEFWSGVAYLSMAGGVVGALAAAVPGAIDLFTTDDQNIKRIGLLHMTLNLVLVALFLINLFWRTEAAAGNIGPIWLSAIGVVLLGLSGWLGGEMVYVHGAGVTPQALHGEAATPTYAEGQRERRRPSTVPYFGPERRHARAGM